MPDTTILSAEQLNHYFSLLTAPDATGNELAEGERRIRASHEALRAQVATARSEADELRARLFQTQNLALEYTDGGILSYENPASLVSWKDVTKDNHGREPSFLASKLQRESDSIDPSTFPEPQRQYTEGRKSGLHQAAQIVRSLTTEKGQKP